MNYRPCVVSSIAFRTDADTELLASRSSTLPGLSCQKAGLHDVPLQLCRRTQYQPPMLHLQVRLPFTPASLCAHPLACDSCHSSPTPRTPFTDPVTTMTCQHTFCRECITRALSHAPQCPVDRSPLCEDDLGPVNPIVRSVSPLLPSPWSSD